MFLNKRYPYEKRLGFDCCIYTVGNRRVLSIYSEEPRFSIGRQGGMQCKIGM